MLSRLLVLAAPLVVIPSISSTAVLAAPLCKYKIEVVSVSLPDYDGCYAAALSDNDHIVGTCYQDPPREEKRMFRWKSGVTTDLGVLSGMNRGIGYGVNNYGDAVGYSSVSFDPTTVDAHLYRNGTLQDIELWASFPMLDTYAADINDHGEIVGVDDYGRAVYWFEGQDPIYLGDYTTRATSINNAGQIAGTAQGHAARWDCWNLVDLGTLPGGYYAEAQDLAENGNIAGWGSSAHGFRGFFASPDMTSIKEIGTFGGSASWAYGVSSDGQVVGYANDALGGSRGFVWRKGTLYDLNTMLGQNTLPDPWVVDSAVDINEKGDILATASNSIGYSYVLLHPRSCSPSLSACCPF